MTSHITRLASLLIVPALLCGLAAPAFAAGNWDLPEGAIAPDVKTRVDAVPEFKGAATEANVRAHVSRIVGDFLKKPRVSNLFRTEPVADLFIYEKAGVSVAKAVATLREAGLTAEASRVEKDFLAEMKETTANERNQGRWLRQALAVKSFHAERGTLDGNEATQLKTMAKRYVKHPHTLLVLSRIAAAGGRHDDASGIVMQVRVMTHGKPSSDAAKLLRALDSHASTSPQRASTGAVRTTTGSRPGARTATGRSVTARPGTRT